MKKKYKVVGKNDSLHITLSIPESYQKRVDTREILELIYRFEHAKTVEEQVVVIPQVSIFSNITNNLICQTKV